jgi:predicted AAA+ superfamily ATPase
MVYHNDHMKLEKVIEFSEIAAKQALTHEKARSVLEQVVSHSDKTILALHGPRGAGKTILLKQALNRISDSIYISVDQLDHDQDIFSLVRELNESYQFTTFLLDEVHFNSDITRHLKTIFDLLPVRLIITSSVAVKTIETAHDLSRRVRIVRVSYFSFREFLAFQGISVLPTLRLSQILTEEVPASYITSTIHFHRYLEGMMLPFSLEVTKWKEALEKTLEKIIGDDLPRVEPITLAEINSIRKMIHFIGSSQIDGINPTSIAKNIGITRYKANQYLSLLSDAFVIQQIEPKGTNVLREPKVLMMPPLRLLFQDLGAAMGGLREDFAVNALSRVGYVPQYLKGLRGEKTADYYVEFEGQKFLLEIGGASKGRGQLFSKEKDTGGVILKDGPPYNSAHRPLALLGFLD